MVVVAGEEETPLSEWEAELRSPAGEAGLQWGGVSKDFSIKWNRDFWSVQIASLWWSFNDSEGPLSMNHSSGHYSWIKTFAICSCLKCRSRENLFPDETGKEKRNAHIVSAGHMFFPSRCICLESSAQSWRMQGRRKRRGNYRYKLPKNFLRLRGLGKVPMAAFSLQIFCLYSQNQGYLHDPDTAPSCKLNPLFLVASFEVCFLRNWVWDNGPQTWVHSGFYNIDSREL